MKNVKIIHKNRLFPTLRWLKFMYWNFMYIYLSISLFVIYKYIYCMCIYIYIYILDRDKRVKEKQKKPANQICKFAVILSFMVSYLINFQAALILIEACFYRSKRFNWYSNTTQLTDIRTIKQLFIQSQRKFFVCFMFAIFFLCQH